MGVWVRLPVFAAILAPFLIATHLRAPWWQTALAALVASLVSQWAWWLSRARPVTKWPIIVVGVATAIGGSAWILIRESRAVPFYVEADEVALDLGALDGRRLRVHGYARPGSLRRGADGLELLVVQKDKGLLVRYRGALPDSLRDGMEVTAAGTLSGRVLVADDLLVKCPSNYDRSKGLKPF